MPSIVPTSRCSASRTPRGSGRSPTWRGTGPRSWRPDMLTPTEAARLILEHIAPLPAARRPLRETLDRVLAEDVKSPIDLPAWDNSAMDGYAARAVDVESAAPDHTVALAVIEAVAAGQFPTRSIGPGQVTRIFTGAPLPAGADTVVRQEDTEPAESGRIRGVTGRDARKNVRYRGEGLRKGDVVLGAGTPLGPAQLGVLASIAHATPLVYDAPRVAFMGSGDEIVDLDRADDILSGNKVATSNSYTLHALIKQNGGIPVDLGLARDTKESLRDHFAAARPGSDLLVTTAGVSVGEPIKLGPKLRHFLRAVVVPEGPGGMGGKLTARLTGPQGSGILTSMARANALLIVPEDRHSVAAGETLAALLLDDPHHVAEAPF